MPNDKVIPPPGFTLDIPPPPDGSGIIPMRRSVPIPDGATTATAASSPRAVPIPDEATTIPPPPDGSGIVRVPPGYTLEGRVPPGYTLEAQEPAPKASLGSQLAHGAKELLDKFNYPKAIADLAKSPITHPFTQRDPNASMLNDLIPGIDSYSAQVKNGIQAAHDAFTRGDYATAAAKALYGVIPLMGPDVERSAGQFMSGDIAGGIGSSIGIGLNVAGPAALKNIKMPAAIGDAAESVAGKVYRGALKPPPGTNVGKVASAVRAGLSEGIPISDAGVRKLYAALGDYEAAKPDFAGSAGSTPISVDRSLQNLDSLEAQAGKNALPTSNVAAVQAAREEFLTANRPGGPIRRPDGSLRPLTAAEAQEMKQATQRSVSASYQRGVKAPPVADFGVKAQQGIASGLRDELAEQFPELQASNEGQQGLKSLQPLLLNRVATLANQSRVGVSTPLVSMAVHALTGSWEAGAAAGVAKWVFDSPAITSRLAVAISKAGKVSFPAANLRVQGYLNALGQGADAASSGTPTGLSPAGAPSLARGTQNDPLAIR